MEFKVDYDPNTDQIGGYHNLISPANGRVVVTTGMVYILAVKRDDGSVRYGYYRTDNGKKIGEDDGPD